MNNLERELKIRGFSRKTVKSYLYYNRNFLNYARKSPKGINNKDIKKYSEYLADRQVSIVSLSLVINALKFYYTQVLKRKFLSSNKEKGNEFLFVAFGIFFNLLNTFLLYPSNHEEASFLFSAT